MNPSRFIFLSLCAVSFSACTLGPNFIRPQVITQTQFRDGAAAQESVANLEWWDFFHDPELLSLIRSAISKNHDLQLALARIEESRARLGYVRADLFPQLSGSGSIGRGKPSNEFAQSGSASNDYFGGVNLNYEIDLWGKLRRATDAERAQLLATTYAAKAVTMALVSQVATSYLQLLDLDSRLEISRRTLANRQSATNLIRTRFHQGVVAELDVKQAEIEEGEAAVNVATFERQIRQTENALSVLLGEMPREIKRSSVFERKFLPNELPSGLPAQLLERRPDVRAAEETAISQVARIGVAEALGYPSIGLSGLIGYESRDEAQLFDANALTWNLGGSLFGPLIDFGKSRSYVEVAEAQADQALITYEQTVVRAVQEVEDALVSIRTFEDEYKIRVAQRSAAESAASLSRARYNDGVAPYLEVLDSERSLFVSELAASVALRNYLSSIVTLYRALGGGWSPEPPTPSNP